MFCYPARVISRFSVNSCRNPIIFNHHQYFWEIEVCSEFRHSPTKIKSSCPPVAPLPKNGQNLGWAPENDPYLWNKFFGGFGPMGKLLPRIYWWYVVLQKLSFQNKKLTFGPKYPNFGVKIAHFVPSVQLEPHRSMFSTQKRCLISSLIWENLKFYSLTPKWWFWPKTGLFGPFDPMPDQTRQCEGGA